MTKIHKIKKIFLILLSILAISYSQYIFAVDDFIPPEGVLRYENPDAHSGLVIILGKRRAESPEDKHYLDTFKYLNVNLKRDMEAAKAAHSVNILYINLHNREFSLADIESEIREFSKKNREISIISMIHGSVIFPWENHTIGIGPDASNDIYRYFAGHFILSSDFFKSISRAVGDKPIKMWQCSCQGSQTIKDAQNLLPKNSIFVTEGEGWVDRPDVLGYALSRVLRSGDAFNFHELLLNYAYTPNLFTKKFGYEDNYYYDALFNFNPIYTVIGGESISLVDRANEFLEKCRSKQIDSKKIQETLDELCNLIIPLDDYFIHPLDGNNFLDTCIASGKQELQEVIDEGASVADCTTHNGERSYVVELLMEKLFKVAQKKNLECELDWAQYMFLISLGAASIEEDFANSCIASLN